MTAERFPRIVGWVGAFFFLGSGLWAFLGPRSFFDQLATFEPYNRHFLHDVGSFSIGVGAVLALALVTRWDALRVALVGAGVGAVFHVVSHAIDSDLGGKSTDIPGLALVAIALLAAAVPSRQREQVAAR